jgi:hypothetical protein
VFINRGEGGGGGVTTTLNGVLLSFCSKTSTLLNSRTNGMPTSASHWQTSFSHTNGERRDMLLRCGIIGHIAVGVADFV